MRFAVSVGVACTLMLCSCSRSVPENTAAPAVASDLPVVTVVDKPRDGDTVQGVLNAAGWALIPEGTRSITVAIDGKRQFPAQIDIPRGDVAQAYPQYKNNKAGWNAVIPLTDIPAGVHTVSISAVSNSGKAVGISSLKVTVK